MNDLREIAGYEEEYLKKAEEIDSREIDGDTKDELKYRKFGFYKMLMRRDLDVKNKFRFEKKKKAVLDGRSTLLKNWQKHSKITTEEFLEALLWVCSDPKNGGKDKCRLTREIALTPNGVKKLARVYDDGMLGFGDLETMTSSGTMKRWEGEAFEVECGKEWSSTGKMRILQKISISAENTIF